MPESLIAQDIKTLPHLCCSLSLDSRRCLGARLCRQIASPQFVDLQRQRRGETVSHIQAPPAHQQGQVEEEPGRGRQWAPALLSPNDGSLMRLPGAYSGSRTPKQYVETVHGACPSCMPRVDGVPQCKRREPGKISSRSESCARPVPHKAAGCGAYASSLRLERSSPITATLCVTGQGRHGAGR